MESLKKKHLSDVGLWPADIGISGQWCDIYLVLIPASTYSSPRSLEQRR
jgi:hypothetical protein